MMREIEFRGWDKEKRQFFDNPNIYLCQQKPERYELVEYTGLRDKNGVKVFEGNIVTVLSPSAKATYTGEVRWNTRATGFDVIEPSPYRPGREITHRMYNATVEVIGDIRMNPELLESAA